MPPIESSPGSAEEPDARFPYGNLLRSLTAAISADPGLRATAAVLHQLVDGNDGLLTRLAELFDTAADQARAHDKDDGDDDAFYLAKDLAEAAAQVRRLGEDLHVAPERMASLPPSRHHPPLDFSLPPVPTAPPPGRTP
ncbi:hypothetical protein [Streptomyces microflavus]|uniref:hypothetical protein n=1 Tax=Streptomyces microflavus TaxID=1919 RepID=UPI002E32BAA2|nr:hypothetical protein [Streptomyces microflavus]